MSITISNFTYGPAPYVGENGGQLYFHWDTALDCMPGIPATFNWQIDLLQSDGLTVWKTLTGSAPPAATVHVDAYLTVNAMTGPIPHGGIRPQITVNADCAGTHVEQFCTGITEIPYLWNMTAHQPGTCSIGG